MKKQKPLTMVALTVVVLVVSNYIYERWRPRIAQFLCESPYSVRIIRPSLERKGSEWEGRP